MEKNNSVNLRLECGDKDFAIDVINYANKLDIALDINSPNALTDSIDGNELEIDGFETEVQEGGSAGARWMMNVWNYYKNTIMERSEYLRIRESPSFNRMMGHVIYHFVEILAQHRNIKYVDIRGMVFDVLAQDPKTYNLTEAAKELGISKNYILTELKLGRIFGKKINGKWQFTETDLDFIVFSLV